jgi:hypothetical protein
MLAHEIGIENLQISAASKYFEALLPKALQNLFEKYSDNYNFRPELNTSSQDDTNPLANTTIQGDCCQIFQLVGQLGASLRSLWGQDIPLVIGLVPAAGEIQSQSHSHVLLSKNTNLI